MPLAEIRRAIGLTQVELAASLDIAQGSVSKIENQADMYISTLRKFVHALGGELHLTAAFPDGQEGYNSQQKTSRGFRNSDQVDVIDKAG